MKKKKYRFFIYSNIIYFYPVSSKLISQISCQISIRYNPSLQYTLYKMINIYISLYSIASEVDLGSSFVNKI